MLFYRDNPKKCEFCAWADSTVSGRMLCYKKGPVGRDYACPSFRYDPYKRVPPPRAKLRKAEIADISRE